MLQIGSVSEMVTALLKYFVSQINTEEEECLQKQAHTILHNSHLKNGVNRETNN